MLNQTTAKLLLSAGRRQFSEAEKDEALKYFTESGCTLQEAAEQYGMSTQTLSIHRNKVLVHHGLAVARPKKKKAKAKKAD
jgi:transposase-like protein